MKRMAAGAVLGECPLPGAEAVGKRADRFLKTVDAGGGADL